MGTIVNGILHELNTRNTRSNMVDESNAVNVNKEHLPKETVELLGDFESRLLSSKFQENPGIPPTFLGES